MNKPRTSRVLLPALLIALVVAIAGADDPLTRQDTISMTEHRSYLDSGITQPDDSHVLYELPGQADVRVYTVTYSEAWGEMDIYYPGDFDFGHPLPALVMMPGYSDSVLRRNYGVSWRQWRRSGDWASLLAASGLAAVVWESGAPYFSARDAMIFLSTNGRNLKIDVQNLGVLAVSAQALPAMQLLSHGEIPGVRGVDAIAMMYPSDQSSYLPAYSPSFYIVRAGSDQKDILDDLDRYIERLRTHGHEAVIVRYEDAFQHFDVNLDTPETGKVIQGVLNFLVSELLER